MFCLLIWIEARSLKCRADLSRAQPLPQNYLLRQYLGQTFDDYHFTAESLDQEIVLLKATSTLNIPEVCLELQAATLNVTLPIVGVFGYEQKHVVVYHLQSFEFLDNYKGQLLDHEITKLTKLVVQSVIAMHSKGVVHGMLSPKNILFRTVPLFEIKIANFRRAAFVSSAKVVLPIGKANPDMPLSPEVILGQQPSQKSDVWGIGLTLLYMALPKESTLLRIKTIKEFYQALAGQPLSKRQTDQGTLRILLKRQLGQDRYQSYGQVLLRTLQVDPSKRTSESQLLNSSLLRGLASFDEDTV